MQDELESGFCDNGDACCVPGVQPLLVIRTCDFDNGICTPDGVCPDGTSPATGYCDAGICCTPCAAPL
jgi:hypothetical protein